MSDQLPFVVRSRYQLIELTQDRHGHLVLLLDGAQQFHAFDEHRYHEAFAVVPSVFSPEPIGHAVILGGGDGLLAARLLALGVERVTVVEIDDYVIDLARHHARLRALNGDSFADPRVEVIEGDATAWIRERPPGSVDALFVDFPDVLRSSLESLYDESFYAACRHALRDGGVLTSQVKFTPRYFGSVLARLGRAFGHVTPYHVNVPTHVMAGFIMASAQPLRRARSLPSWPRSVDEASLAGMLRLPTDLAAYLEEPSPPLAMTAAAVADAEFFKGLAPVRVRR